MTYFAVPEPCLKDRCWSPGACSGWGYCRERNMLPPDDPKARDPNALHPQSEPKP